MDTTPSGREPLPELDPITKTRRKDVSWYLQEGPDLSKEARSILEDYSHIPPEEVHSHVRAIREKAWEVFPYPCIGLFRFMNLSMYRLPVYPMILERLKAGEVFLDLGCCFGQEIRDIVHAGVPSKNLFGSDLREEFWEIGYELFKDRETLGSTFFAGDVFDESEHSSLRELDEKVDIVYAGSFFHLFSWEQQVQVAKRIVRLLKPVKGSMIVGRQAGRKVGGMVPSRSRLVGSMWRHDAESWKKLWRGVGWETGTDWEVKAEGESFTGKELEFLAGDGRGIGHEAGEGGLIIFSFCYSQLTLLHRGHQIHICGGKTLTGQQNPHSKVVGFPSVSPFMQLKIGWISHRKFDPHAL
jgi:SAM-dependent methyltransferase